MREDVVHHLRDVVGLDPSEIPGIYGIFLKTLADSLVGLRAAADPVDFRAIRSATHLLMGFSRNVGAADLGDAARALNAAAHAAEAEACRIGIREIEELCATYRDDALAPPPSQP